MRFNPDRCPLCGGKPSAIIEAVEAKALLNEQDDGSFAYAGESDILWDTQAPVVENGKLILICDDCGCDFAAEDLDKLEAQLIANGTEALPE